MASIKINKESGISYAKFSMPTMESAFDTIGLKDVDVQDKPQIILQGGEFIRVDGVCYQFREYGPARSYLHLRCGQENSTLPGRTKFEMVTKQDYLEFVDVEKKKREKVFDYDCTVEEAKDYMKQDYSERQKNITCTYNHFQTGVYNKDVFLLYQNEMDERAYNKLKDSTETILFKAPYDWCILNGYNSRFIDEYLQVINSFGIGHAEVVSLGEDESFKNYGKLTSYNGLKNNLFYTIKITTEGNHLQSFCKMVVDIYNSNFAGLFMQFRRRFPEHTDWQNYLFTEVLLNEFEGVGGIRTLKVNGRVYTSLPNIFTPLNSLEGLVHDCGESNCKLDQLVLQVMISDLYTAPMKKEVKCKNYERALNIYTKLIK